jgi:high affinity Mn2+ porin
LRQMAQRLERLEQRNQELERQVKALQGPAPALQGAATTGPDGGDARRVELIEREQRALAQRLDDLSRQGDLQAGSESEGPKIGASMVGVAQNVNRAGTADGRAGTRANYRGDLTIELSAGGIGGAQATAFGQLRFGQGEGLALRPTHTSTTNSVGFQTAAGPDDSFAILAQGYLNLEWALGGGGLNEQKGDRFEITAGKIDVFSFFDQNAAAGDEAAQFLNNAFVHNPLLDSGGDVGADAYGFAPGIRMAYTRVGDGSSQWGASLGLFAAGSGANFSGGLGRPLAIAQLEWSPLQINGEPRGSYRIYAWTNGRTSALDGTPQRHTGVGLSVDQRVGRDWNLFGRAGRRTSGVGTFDSALTLGFEHGGRAWGRGRDAVGLAVGLLKTSPAWRDATSADVALVGYAATGQERIAEVFYRWRLNEHLALSPDFQLIQRPGGDSAGKTVRVFGVRASASF